MFVRHCDAWLNLDAASCPLKRFEPPSADGWRQMFKYLVGRRHSAPVIARQDASWVLPAIDVGEWTSRAKSLEDTIAKKEETACKYSVFEPNAIPGPTEDEGKRRERTVGQHQRSNDPSLQQDDWCGFPRADQRVSLTEQRVRRREK